MVVIKYIYRQDLFPVSHEMPGDLSTVIEQSKILLYDRNIEDEAA